MLYKAALKDTSTISSVELDEEVISATIAPHPYFMALGVLSIQKVCYFDSVNSNNIIVEYF